MNLKDSSVYIDELQRAVGELAWLREELARVDTALNTLNSEVRDRCPQLLELSERREALSSKIKAVESEVRALTMEAYEKTGMEQPADGVKIRLRSNLVVTDYDELLRYCLQSLPVAVAIDLRVVWAVAKHRPVPGVMIVKEPRAIIKRTVRQQDIDT